MSEPLVCWPCRRGVHEKCARGTVESAAACTCRCDHVYAIFRIALSRGQIDGIRRAAAFENKQPHDWLTDVVRRALAERRPVT